METFMNDLITDFNARSTMGAVNAMGEYSLTTEDYLALARAALRRADGDIMRSDVEKAANQLGFKKDAS